MCNIFCRYKLFFLFLVIFFSNRLTLFSDILVTSDNNVISGKIAHVIFEKKADETPKMIRIINIHGIFEISRENLKEFWYTSSVEEDIDILKNMGKEVTDQMKRNIERYYNFKVKRTEEYELEKIIVEEKVSEEKYFNAKIKEINAKRMLHSGIILTAIGATLFSVGLPILIYDVCGYRLVVDEKLSTNERNAEGYQDYINSFYLYTGLLAGSVVGISFGLIMVCAGIPLVVNGLKLRDKNISVQLEINNSFKILLCYSF